MKHMATRDYADSFIGIMHGSLKCGVMDSMMNDDGSEKADYT